MAQRKVLKAAALLFILIASASLCFAGSPTMPGIFGKIAGRVVDKENGEPLPGANVIVEGTTLGAAADVNGYYTILQIPPGTYSVVAKMIGYTDHKQTDVRVRVDLTSKVNFNLKSGVIAGEEVTIVAERPLVIADETGSVTRVSAAEIEDIPTVSTVTDAVRLMPGIIGEGEEIHARGGRSGEVVFMVDGVAINDPLFNSEVVSINKYSVQEIELLTGGFNAEYGNSQSGIVNIVTRSGGPKYSGRIAHFTDHLIGSGRFPSDILNGDNPLEVRTLDYFRGEGPGIRKNSFNTDRTEFNLGGPEPITNNLLPALGFDGLKGKVHFFVSGTAEMSDGYLPNEDQSADLVHQREEFDFIAGDVETPGEAPEVRFVGPEQIRRHPFMQGVLGIDWGGRADNRLNYSARLSYRANSNINTSLSYVGSQSWRDFYSHTLKWLPELSRQDETRNYNIVFNWNHALSAKTFYQVKLGVLKNFRFSYPGMRNGLRVAPDVMNLRVGDGQFHLFDEDFLDPVDSADERQGRDDPREGFRQTGWAYDTWTKHNNLSYTLKVDYVSQFSRHHEIKAGIEWKYQDLSQEFIDGADAKVPSRRANPPDNGPYVETGSIRDFYDRFPNSGAAYLQDKIEFESLILNVGLRYDRFDPGAQVFEIGEQFFVPEGVNNEPVNAKNYLSPRVGLAHPITDRSRLYFFYGRFVQIPTLSELYRRQNRFRVNQNQLNIFGNPDLEAEETISYEIGFDQQLTDNIKIGVTGFFKDIRNQINTEVFGPEAAPFRKLINRDFGNDRGFEFDIVKRFSNYYSANVNYTLMWATTRASDPNLGRTITGVVPYGNVREVPADWDQRHTINANVRFELPDGGGFRLFGLMIDRLSLTTFLRYGSGQPFDIDNDADPTATENSARLPYFLEMDLRFRKDFRLYSDVFASFYLDVNNLLNRRNVLFLQGDEFHRCIECQFTDPETGQLVTKRFPNGNVEGEGTPFDLQPTQLDPPRQILFGFGFRF